MTGTTPATAASKRSWTPCSRAAAHSSSPCWESSCLLAVTTCLPGRHRAQDVVARGLEAAHQLDDEVATPARISSKSPRERVSTPVSSGRSPVTRDDRVGALGQQLGEGRADRAVAEQADAERLRPSDVAASRSS